MSADIQWQRSSFSGGGGEQCIELAQTSDAILIRESDDPRAVITTTRSKLDAFISGVKAGEFDHLVGG
ncbi:DUF397 domain-containing protein [Streptomyces sp. SAJ15]|uniref:DUF397 domain-containing protein n=1 Tax=Streptomyces sp. SAJ15 TaxID=2011095 RepID=UPI001186E270|nr:DUF397 domain-containing protein [Streptomyces sp. SAJ15]TVL92468.1 DUF397 domain-containing protein [Streptomyces sp. SAJ15]